MRLIDRFRNFFAKQSVTELQIALQDERDTSESWKKSYEAATSWNQRYREEIQTLTRQLNEIPKTTPQIQHSQPVGYIEYLSPSGKVVERNDYDNESEFIRDIKSNSYFGEPFTVTIFKDPKAGKHMDISWINDLDTPPKGLKFEEYQTAQALEESPEMAVPAEELEMEP